MTTEDHLQRVQARQHLEDVNQFILGGAGEIIDAPGKISLVWNDPATEQPRYIAVKAAGEDHLLINGRRFPATVSGIRQGLRACLTTQDR